LHSKKTRKSFFYIFNIQYFARLPLRLYKCLSRIIVPSSNSRLTMASKGLFKSSSKKISLQFRKDISKELSRWNKIKYLNLNSFRTRCCKPLIFQNQIIWSNRIHSLKYLRSATFGSKDIVIRKSEFVARLNSFPPNFIKN